MIMQLKLENGLFVGAKIIQGRNCCYEVKPTYATGNGWECFILRDGTIKCVARKKYLDGEHSVKYFINLDGSDKLLLKKPGQPAEVLRRRQILPKGTKITNGIIGLSGGKIDERYAYCRENSFQDFLNEFGISAVKNEDPNKCFILYNHNESGNETFLFTDGKKRKKAERFDSLSSTGVRIYKTYVLITGATWALIKGISEKRQSYQILYTLEKNIMELDGIPSLREKEKKIARLREIASREFWTVEDLKVSLQEIEPNLKEILKLEEPQTFQIVKSSKKSLKTNGYFDHRIYFKNESEVERALELTKGMEFETPKFIEEFLYSNGFQDFRMTKYCASVIVDDIKSSLLISVGTKNDFERVLCWKAEI